MVLLLLLSFHLSYPILGNLPDILFNHADRKLDWCREQHELLGETFKVHFPGPKMSMAVTCNLENIEHVLRTNFKVWDKGHIVHENIVQLLGESGIFCSGWSFVLIEI